MLATHFVLPNISLCCGRARLKRRVNKLLRAKKTPLAKRNVLQERPVKFPMNNLSYLRSVKHSKVTPFLFCGLSGLFVRAMRQRHHVTLLKLCKHKIQRLEFSTECTCMHTLIAKATFLLFLG